MIEIRAERPEDFPAIQNIIARAFGQSTECRIVDNLRANSPNLISLVAVYEHQVVGHIVFSPSVIETSSGRIQGMGLAPIAVLPEFQRQGIGSALIRRGLDILSKQLYPFVIVLGHPEYYPRFGFKRASEYGIECEWEGVPDEAFMAIIFDRDVMRDVSGIARYREEFDVD